MSRVIGLLTDFGEADVYVGVMKGVILGICPDAALVDITHAVAPQSIPHGAFALLTAYRYFPTGSIFVVVVDPGVGGARKPIAVRAGGYTFVAPDNGVLSHALAELGKFQVVELSNPRYRLSQLSYSFHGRDLFAPAAAYLAVGAPLESFGAEVPEIKRLPPLTIGQADKTLIGEVLYADHFGNLITNIGRLGWTTPEQLTLFPGVNGITTAAQITLEGASVIVGGVTVPIRHTYAEAEAGDLLALVGSSGYLEIAVNGGSAAARLNSSLGAAVELRLA